MVRAAGRGEAAPVWAKIIEVFQAATQSPQGRGKQTGRPTAVIHTTLLHFAEVVIRKPSLRARLLVRFHRLNVLSEKAYLAKALPPIVFNTTVPIHATIRQEISMLRTESFAVAKLTSFH